MGEHAPPPRNRLAHETSPYLLQHAGNPVDWYAWGDEALARAKHEQKPIFLSIGYSACHWCHVMERESFENEETAALMNRLFVNIKVDREERPDIDEIYMKAVTALTGSGGWPMSVFLTPDLQPFFGGTYFPPVRRWGRPSFPDVLISLSEAWEKQREEVFAQAEQLTSAIKQEAEADLRGELAADILDRAAAQLLESFDPNWGGFGGAPKFPHSGDIRALLRSAARTNDADALHAATHTLDRMAAGGIFDQLGGGFHRYSTDEKWCIPHFEKMLYDNALLVPAYLEAHLVTGKPEYAEVAAQTCDWVLREMITPEGGFASAQDADSEGEEGRFFAWTPEQIEAVLGAEAGARVATYYDVTPHGNFEDGKSALWRPEPLRDVAKRLRIDEAVLRDTVAAARAPLFEARDRRVHPQTDDKVLAAWNGLMLSALAQAYQVLETPGYLAAAQRAARYVLTGMRQPDGRLFATARGGRAHLNACLDDYVFMIQGLIDLYESDFDATWLREAFALCDVVETRFADREHGGYTTTGEGHETLIARTKNVHDGALPSGTGVQALNLLRLAELGSRAELRDQAHTVIRAQAALVNRHPRLFSQLLLAVDFAECGPREVVISGELGDAPTGELLRAVRRAFVPQRVVALAHSGADTALLPLTSGRTPSTPEAKAYVCRNFVCKAPVTDARSLVSALREAT
jgi:uncharacterized protein YyaL (SSP411 family)